MNDDTPPTPPAPATPPATPPAPAPAAAPDLKKKGKIPKALREYQKNKARKAVERPSGGFGWLVGVVVAAILVIGAVVAGKAQDKGPGPGGASV